MKNNILFIIAWLLYSISYAQKSRTIDDVAYTKCTYRLSFHPDSTDTNKIFTESYNLFCGKKFSLFQAVNKVKLDSAINNFSAKNSQAINSSVFPKVFFTQSIYKNAPPSGITTLDRIETKEYAYTQPIKIFNWKTTTEKQKIAGYSCIKSVTSYAGRIWEAWYTPEVPLSDGPFKFTGLPGLIIKLQDTKKQYVYELTDIAYNTAVPIRFADVNIPYTTRDEFRKNSAEFEKNYVNIVLARGGSTFGDPETARKRVEANRKRRNNPIELK